MTQNAVLDKVKKMVY